MERSDEEVGAQESARGSAWQVRWGGPQRGQAARQPGERAQGRAGQKPPQDARLSTQRASSSSSSSGQAVTVAIALTRAPFASLPICLAEPALLHTPASL